MTDLVPKGTGNSRLLRSSIPENITHEELVALLRAGTFPVDFAGLNADGVAVVGSAYNKANVLPDSVCELLGIPTSSEPKDAFTELGNKFDQNFVTGTYSGSYSKDTISINLGFRPKCVLIVSSTMATLGSSSYGYPVASVNFGFLIDGRTISYNQRQYEITDTGFTLTEARSTSAANQKLDNGTRLNGEGLAYAYLAIKY